MSTHLKNAGLLSADQVALYLNCSRAKVERLQLKGLLNPVPTIYPKYFFERKEVESIKDNHFNKSKSIV
jgi:hypothetical protein